MQKHPLIVSVVDDSDGDMHCYRKLNVGECSPCIWSDWQYNTTWYIPWLRMHVVVQTRVCFSTNRCLSLLHGLLLGQMCKWHWALWFTVDTHRFPCMCPSATIQPELISHLNIMTRTMPEVRLEGKNRGNGNHLQFVYNALSIDVVLLTDIQRKQKKKNSAKSE